MHKLYESGKEVIPLPEEEQMLQQDTNDFSEESDVLESSDSDQGDIGEFQQTVQNNLQAATELEQNLSEDTQTQQDQANTSPTSDSNTSDTSETSDTESREPEESRATTHAQQSEAAHTAETAQQPAPPTVAEAAQQPDQEQPVSDTVLQRVEKMRASTFGQMVAKTKNLPSTLPPVQPTRTDKVKKAIGSGIQTSMKVLGKTTLVSTAIVTGAASVKAGMGYATLNGNKNISTDDTKVLNGMTTYGGYVLKGLSVLLTTGSTILKTLGDIKKYGFFSRNSALNLSASIRTAFAYLQAAMPFLTDMKNGISTTAKTWLKVSSNWIDFFNFSLLSFEGIYEIVLKMIRLSKLKSLQKSGSTIAQEKMGGYRSFLISGLTRDGYNVAANTTQTGLKLANAIVSTMSATVADKKSEKAIRLSKASSMIGALSSGISSVKAATDFTLIPSLQKKSQAKLKESMGDTAEANEKITAQYNTLLALTTPAFFLGTKTQPQQPDANAHDQNQWYLDALQQYNNVKDLLYILNIGHKELMNAPSQEAQKNMFAAAFGIQPSSA